LRRPNTRGVAPRPEQNRKHKINEEIAGPTVRVIGDDGEQYGVMTVREALQRAHDADRDLVEISPQADPPVCKIIDYGKFVYEQRKRDRQIGKNQQQKELKEIRLRAGTDTHDLEFKVRHSRKFLLDGHKVKANVLFRGREIVHQDIGRALLQKFIDALADISKTDQDMKTEGRMLSVTLAPDLKKKGGTKKAENQKSKPAVVAPASDAESEPVTNKE